MLGGVLLATFAACLWAFYARRPVPFGADRFPPWPSPALVTAAFLARAAALAAPLSLFWLAAWGLGSAAFERLRPGTETRLERAVFSLALGAGALGGLGFALGAARALSPRPLKLGLAALAAYGAARAAASLRRWAGRREAPALRAALSRPDVLIPAAALAAFLGYALLSAMGPTLFYDSLAYHLALPDLYLRRGALVPTPNNAYAGIPAGVEMLYLWLLPWGELGSPCQLLHLSFAALTVLALMALARRLGRGAAGLWAGALFVSSPMVLLACARPGVELGWSFYLSAATLALAPEDETPRGRRLVLAGLCAGLALGTKYQAVLLLPAAAALLCLRLGPRAGARAAAVVVGVAAVVAAPWGLRNILFYGNPVFPFAGGWFREAASVDVPAFLSSAHGQSLRQTFSSLPGLRHFLTHPWRYAMPLEESEADNVLSLALPALAPLAFAAPKGGAARRLLVFGALLWLPMNLLSGLARFSIPALVPLSLGLALLLVELRGLARRAAALGLSAVFATSLVYVHSKTDAQLWRLLAGDIPMSSYLSRQRPIYPAPPFAAYRWLGDHAPVDARVLLVGEPRSFYLERDAETSSPYASQPLADYANASSSGDDLYRRLRADGITHVVMNLAAMASSQQTMRMSEPGLAALKDFWARDLEAVFVDRSEREHDVRFTIVYRLLTPEEANRPHSPVDVPFGPSARRG